jgi:hypothetical protein
MQNEVVVGLGCGWTNKFILQGVAKHQAFLFLPVMTEMVSPLPPSEWHSIRPWSTPLALSVREITSVSATFILSSSLTSGDSDPSLASLGLGAVHSDSDSDDDSENKKAIIFDALAKGLSVNVNGTPWQRVLVRIDDKTDEGVIIIYGLMPGRQYDIDLGLIQGGQSNSIRKQVVTEGLCPLALGISFFLIRSNRIKSRGSA